MASERNHCGRCGEAGHNVVTCRYVALPLREDTCTCRTRRRDAVPGVKLSPCYWHRTYRREARKAARAERAA